jgi:hypothetical protein
VLRIIDRNKKFYFRQCKASEKHFPVAHVCAWQVDMPSYSNKETLREKLTIAIQERQFHIG